MISICRKLLVAVVLASQVGCGTTFQYTPRFISKGEISLRGSTWNSDFYGGTKWIASTRSEYAGLEGFVHCVAIAKRHAASANFLQVLSRRLRVTAWIGGAAGLVLLPIGLADDRSDLSAWAGGLFGAALGLTIGAAALQHRALGHALDAMNHYNDAVGSLGRTCSSAILPPWQPPNRVPEGVAGPDLPR